MSVELKRSKCHGHYTFFSADTIIPGGSDASTVDITGGHYVEEVRYADEIGEKCWPFKGGRYSSFDDVPSVGSVSGRYSSATDGGTATWASESGSGTSNASSKPSGDESREDGLTDAGLSEEASREDE